MKIVGFGATDTGPTREKNDDTFLVDNELQLYIVCDGVGGTYGGNIASDLAVRTVRSYIAEKLATAKNLEVSAVDSILKDAVQAACTAVYEKAQSEPVLSKMGTTLSLFLSYGTGGFVAHVGDSSIFIKRGQKVHKLTMDHTFVGEMTRMGQMSAKEAENCPFAHVLTRWIGQAEALQVDTLYFELLPEDVIFLCSDGLESVYSQEDEFQKLLSADSLEGLPEKCIALANQRDGSDNSSALVISVQPVGTADHQEEDRVRTVSLSIETLEQMFLFQGIALKDLMLIIERSSVYTAPEKQIIIREGDEGDSLFMILEGTVRVVRSGQELTVLKRGSHFGEMALLNNEPRSATIISRQESKLLIIDRTGFMEIVKNRPEIGAQLLFNMAQELAIRLKQSNEQHYGDVTFTFS